MSSQVGLIGLGTMGAALAQNIASRGFKVSVWNRSYEKVTDFVKKHGDEKFYAPENFEDFIESIEQPRKIIMLVPAGKATKDVLEKLGPVLEKGDVVMDGGNALFRVTESYQNQLLKKDIRLLGVGISGGEDGALHGPSIMPGGDKEAWDIFEPILSAIAAEDFNHKACVSYMGKGGAGHYVKMVHNGIEYAEMQMLAEAYDILTKLYKVQPLEIAEIFKKWSEGRLSSFLVDISVDVLQKEEGGRPLLDLIMDKAGQKGTGTWTVQEALRLGVPVPSIAAAVFMRGISTNKDQRVELAELYPMQDRTPNLLLSECVDHLEKALFATRIANFEQGFALLRAANIENDYDLNFPEIARVWQGGCIIRSSILADVHDAYKQKVQNLYFTDFAHDAIVDAQKSWRRIVMLATEHCLPISSISGGLTHFEAYRRSRLSANFIQGLRDRFGSHTYERIDKDGSFHTNWT